MQEMRVQSLSQEDTLEKEMATHSRILAWEIPWTEEPGGLQSTGLQRVRHNWATKQQQQTDSCYCSVAKSCLTLCDPMGCSASGFPVLHYLPEFAKAHVHRVSDAIQPSHPLSSLSPPVFNLSQHQSLLQWVGSSHQMAKILELQLQHQSFQWIFRVDFL